MKYETAGCLSLTGKLDPKMSNKVRFAQDNKTRYNWLDTWLIFILFLNG